MTAAFPYFPHFGKKIRSGAGMDATTILTQGAFASSDPALTQTPSNRNVTRQLPVTQTHFAASRIDPKPIALPGRL